MEGSSLADASIIRRDLDVGHAFLVGKVKLGPLKLSDASSEPSSFEHNETVVGSILENSSCAKSSCQFGKFALKIF